MDNAPIHDEAQYDPKSGCLDQADVGLNSLLALDGEVLALFARHRGDAKTAERLEDRAAALRARIQERLWDPQRGIFANRRWNGNFIRSLAPTSFYPMLANAASTEQQASLLKWLDDPKAFGGAHRLPSVTRDDPAYHDNVYWRGRVWPPLNYLSYGGLKRCGYGAAASALAADSVKLFATAWAKRQMPENFSAETGAADDQVDTDLFYGWGGLMPLIGINEIIDVTPWQGWEINPRPPGIKSSGAKGDWRLGPLLAFGRRCELVSKGGWLTLTLDEQPVLRTDIATLLSRIEIRDGGIDLETQGGGTIVLSAPATGDVQSAKFDGREIKVAEGAVTLPQTDTPRRLELRWT
jgi:putative isomerase